MTVSRRFSFPHIFSRFLHVILPLAALMIGSSAAKAQGGMTEGSRVQISASGIDRLTGILRSRTADSTTIFVESSGGMRQFANSEITELRVSRGRSTGRGATKGLAWGGAIGAGLALLSLSIENYSSQYNGTDVVAQSIAGGLLWGAGIGALVKSESWDTVQPRVSVTALSRGVGMSFAFHPAFFH